MASFKLAIEQAELALTALDTAAQVIQQGVESGQLKLSFEEAKPMVQMLDHLADAIEVSSMGKQSFENRRAEVIERDKDEPYMDTFKNPMKPLVTDKDEPYMAAYSDDQSSAVHHGKSETGRPLAPLDGNESHAGLLDTNQGLSARGHGSEDGPCRGVEPVHGGSQARPPRDRLP